MNKKIFLRPALIFSMLLFLSLHDYAQVVVERSTNKVTISGTPYYIHLVKKGETAYSISKAYNITVEELTRENPPSVYGVNEGQALRIPVREVITGSVDTKPVTARQKDEKRYIYHNLLAGETIYSLSKLYGVSENDIITANPGIDITKLPVNSEIAVPRRDFMTIKQEFAVQDSKYIFHKVVRGESLSSIAEQYGLTVREVRRENRDVRFPQVGDYIRIPADKLQNAVVADIEEPDSSVVVPDEPAVARKRPPEHTVVQNLSGSFEIAVLLPFYLKENAVRSEIDSSRFIKGKRQKRIVARPDDWIYQANLGFIEMYEGILLAADTLRSLGLDISLHVYDIKSDTLEVSRLIREGKLAGMDLIIGPVYSANLSIVTNYARNLGIPVVSPVRLLNTGALQGNPHLFMSNPSLGVAQDIIARKISGYYDHNFVFIHTDTAGGDQDVKNFKARILNELSNRLPYNEIRFKEFIFYSRSAFDNDSINRLGHALSGMTGNVIVIASEDDPVISETLQEIHALTRKFDIKVYGYPAIRGLDNLDFKYFFDLNLLIFSPFWIDYSRPDIKRFTTLFRKKFFTEPSEMSYAWMGYDLAYYFLSGLAIHGREFISHPEIHYPDLLQTEFDFKRTNQADGFENQKLFPVRYSKEYEIKLEPEAITEPEPDPI